jgi:DNA-binding PadR family transcriptional regulator
MGKRAKALELAILGLLHDSPMHGYELRKRVNTLLGWGRAFSYGSLYPALKDMVEHNYLAEHQPVHSGSTDAPLRGGRRGKIVYELTPKGEEHFAGLLAQTGPTAWDDEHFGVHFAFFARADADTRMRILIGRRSRLQERLDQFRSSLSRTRERLDTYTLELQRHGLESVEREVKWVDDLITAEQRSIDTTSAKHVRSRPLRTDTGESPVQPN